MPMAKRSCRTHRPPWHARLAGTRHAACNPALRLRRPGHRL